jgi:glycosyltransferase involved in cell wall biosynthesis
VSAPLGIVVPAYKGRFLDAALASIAAQTRRDFVVYVGDDASPDDLPAICARHAARLPLRYTRFSANLGGHDLVSQWQRCIALGDEPWVWMFGDDDVMPADGVARVLAAIEAEGSRTDLFHFDVDTIDADGGLVRSEPRFAPHLSARAFALRRLRFELSSFAPDYVFARGAFERHGGFVRFPRGWCSDDATWIALAERGGIRTLSGAPLRWRLSGANISSRHGEDAALKAQALLQFVRWLREHLRRHPAAPGEPADEQLLAALPPWFFRQIRFLGVELRPALAASVQGALAGLPGVSRPGLWARMWNEDRQLARRRRRAGRGAGSSS